jgi:DNA-binding response OmpR family regulator
MRPGRTARRRSSVAHGARCGRFVAVVLAFADGLELDTALFELRRGGQAVPLEPQAFDVLAYLVAHRDRVVPKEELMDGLGRPVRLRCRGHQPDQAGPPRGR